MLNLLFISVLKLKILLKKLYVSNIFCIFMV